MMPKIDPFDMLIDMNRRLVLLQEAHNNLAEAHNQSQTELNITLFALQNLQKHVVNLEHKIKLYQRDQINKQSV